MLKLKEKNIKAAINNSVSTVIEQMAFLDVEPAKEVRFVSEPKYFIHMESPINGALIFSIPDTSKKNLAGNIYGKDFSEIKMNEINECLLELVNIITGQFLNKLDIKNAQYILGIPKIIFREEDLYTYSHNYNYFFNAEGSEFQIKLMLNKPIDRFPYRYKLDAEIAKKNAHLLFIDDNPVDLKIYQNYLEGNSYTIDTVTNIYDGLKIIKKQHPDLILLDIEMPRINGIKALQYLKKNKKYKNIPVIMISSRTDEKTIKKCFELGADDYLRKPFYKDEFLMRIKLRIKNLVSEQHASSRRMYLEMEILQKAHELTDMKDATIFALAKLAESRDPETASHLDRIMEYVKIISEELSSQEKYYGIINNEFIHNIYHMSILHDIGKVGIPDSILLKEGKLTSEEFEVMKKHTTIGAESLGEISHRNKVSLFMIMAHDIARHHHEKWNGMGYPDRLKGEKIPLAARITALADIYDALSVKRVYKEAFPTEKVEKIMNEEAGVTFDPDIYEAYRKTKHKFLEIKEKYQEKEANNCIIA